MAFGLADIFSGGADSAAGGNLSQALEDVGGVATPSAAQLTLPQLQQYVQAGILTPEQAQAYLVNTNALQGVTAQNAGLDTELSTIGQLQDMINSGGLDAEEQASLQQVLNTMNTTESGANQAVVRQNAAQGISNSGLTEAAELANNQGEAQNANTQALGAAANAEAAKEAELASAGSLGAGVQGQEYTAAENTANAANAIAQFNANQNQAVGNLNTTEANAAQAANLATAQQVSNANTQTQQMQEESVPAAQQQAYEDALNKATAEAGVGEAQANQNTQVGQQNAGILGGLIGAGGTVTAAEMSGNPYAALATAINANNTNNNTNNTATANGNLPVVASGGRIMEGGVARPMNMKAGGPVPGMAQVPGDSPQNDTQLAKLSPGEIVLPRSVTQPVPQPSKVMQFLKTLPRPQGQPSIHPKAVLDTLKALSMHHAGTA